MLKTAWKIGTMTSLAGALLASSTVAGDATGGQDDERKRESRGLREIHVDVGDLGDDEHRVILRRIGDAKNSDAQSQAHKRIIVIHNGETIVDEEWIDGKKVGGGERGGGKPRVRVLRSGGDEHGDVRVEVHAGPEGVKGIDLDIDALLEHAMKGADEGHAETHTHKKIQVVENGKVVRDEEWVDGKKVGGGERGAKKERPADKPYPRSFIPLDIKNAELEALEAKQRALEIQVQQLQRQLEETQAELKKLNRRKKK